MTVLIAGGGIAGLTMALTCHQIGVEAVVLESVRTVAPLGVGINLQPNAIRELFDLGLADELDRIGVEADTFASWEAGSVPLRANHLSRVAGLLSVSLSWLMIGRGPEPTGNHSELSRLRADLASARSRLDDVVNELAVLDQRLADIDDT